jgi:AcrR family transcriptional regulator
MKIREEIRQPEKVRESESASSQKRAARKFGRRRTPRYEGAQITVGNIMQATRELVDAEKWHELSTEKIAARAGVSIGSLYQYFPNREAVVLALYEDASARAAHTVRAMLYDVINMTPDRALKIIVRSLVELYEKDRHVLLGLPLHYPELSLPAMPLSLDNMIRNSTRAYMRLHMPKCSPKHLDTRVFVMENAVVHTVQNYVAHLPENISRQQLIEELSEIVVTHLQQPQKARPRR